MKVGLQSEGKAAHECSVYLGSVSIIVFHSIKIFVHVLCVFHEGAPTFSTVQPCCKMTNRWTLTLIPVCSDVSCTVEFLALCLPSLSLNNSAVQYVWVLSHFTTYSLWSSSTLHLWETLTTCAVTITFRLPLMPFLSFTTKADLHVWCVLQKAKIVDSF